MTCLSDDPLVLLPFHSTALSPPACYPAHPPRAGSWMTDDACGKKRNIHREHLDEKWRVWDRESSIGSTWRERERERERRGRGTFFLYSRALALSLARGKADWSNTCTVAATAAERVATSSSRSNSSAAGAANSNKNSSLLHTHQTNHHHHHHHVRRRSCSRYQIPSHYPLLPRNVSVLDECSERSKATMATNATPLSLVLSLFVYLVFFFFFPPASPLLPLPPSFLPPPICFPFLLYVNEWWGSEDWEFWVLWVCTWDRFESVCWRGLGEFLFVKTLGSWTHGVFAWF